MVTKKQQKPSPPINKVKNCVLGKFRACVDQALIDGKSLERGAWADSGFANVTGSRPACCGN